MHFAGPMVYRQNLSNHLFSENPKLRLKYTLLPGCLISSPSGSSWSPQSLLSFFVSFKCGPPPQLSPMLPFFHSLEDLSFSRTYFPFHEDDSYTSIQVSPLSSHTGFSIKFPERRHLTLCMVKSKGILSVSKWISLLASFCHLLLLLPYLIIWKFNVF